MNNMIHTMLLLQKSSQLSLPLVILCSFWRRSLGIIFFFKILHLWWIRAKWSDNYFRVFQFFYFCLEHVDPAFNFVKATQSFLCFDLLLSSIVPRTIWKNLWGTDYKRYFVTGEKFLCRRGRTRYRSKFIFLQVRSHLRGMLSVITKLLLSSMSESV